MNQTERDILGLNGRIVLESGNDIAPSQFSDVTSYKETATGLGVTTKKGKKKVRKLKKKVTSYRKQGNPENRTTEG